MSVKTFTIIVEHSHQPVGNKKAFIWVLYALRNAICTVGKARSS